MEKDAKNNTVKLDKNPKNSVKKSETTNQKKDASSAKKTKSNGSNPDKIEVKKSSTQKNSNKKTQIPVTKKTQSKKDVVVSVPKEKTVVRKQNAVVKKSSTKSKDEVSSVADKAVLDSVQIVEETTVVVPNEEDYQKRKYTPRKKPDKRMTEEIEEVLRKDSNEPIKQIKEKKKKGRVFYLVFSIVFYASAYFYINNVLYDSKDHLQSALFAFAALFVVFVLLQFNIHMVFINFFRLPFRFLLNASRLEMKHEAELSEKQLKSKIPFARYKAIFTLSLYVLISLLLVGSQIYNGIMDQDKVLVIITQSSLTLIVFLIIVCSWQ
ncbi:MAG: hypothetical protein KJ847_01920, partial [Firmicutes bacterium]|nr:hypothetical protein [Bacillota bacterium]